MGEKIFEKISPLYKFDFVNTITSPITPFIVPPEPKACPILGYENPAFHPYRILFHPVLVHAIRIQSHPVPVLAVRVRIRIAPPPIPVHSIRIQSHPVPVHSVQILLPHHQYRE